MNPGEGDNSLERGALGARRLARNEREAGSPLPVCVLFHPACKFAPAALIAGATPANSSLADRNLTGGDVEATILQWIPISAQ